MERLTNDFLLQGMEIKLEENLDQDFGKKIAGMAHGEKLFGCIQCGNCSAACPMSIYMDYTPRKIIAMVRAGFRQEVLSNRTIWLCASCYQCTVECPKGIKITDVMYALKREAIENRIYPKNFPVPILAKAFFSEVRRRGRISEAYLLMRYYFNYNILKMLSYSSLGMKLLLKGRLSLFEKGMKDKKNLQALLQKRSN